MKTNGLTIAKYYDFLQIVKLRIDKKENIYTQQISKEFNVSASILCVLKEMGIIKPLGYNVYEWNNKIPLTITLVKKIIQTINEKAKVSRNKTGMAQTPLPKPPRNKKRRTPKVEVHINDKQKNELGVIRKFFKWLW